jgi:hypothetical protein
VTAAASPVGRAVAQSCAFAPYIATSELVLRRLGLMLVGLFAQRYFEQLSLTIFKCVTAI